MSSKLDKQHVFFRPNDAEVEVYIAGPQGQQMRILITPSDDGVLVEVQADIDPELNSGDDRLAIDTLDVSWADFDHEIEHVDGGEHYWPCTVEFRAQDEVYGTERYSVLASNKAEALKLALARSDDSGYADDRIDFRREVRVGDPADVDDVEDALDDDEDFEDEDDATDEEQ